MTVAQVTTVTKEACAKDFRGRLGMLFVEAHTRATLHKVIGTTEAWKRFEHELAWLCNAYDSALAHAAADDASAKAAADALLADAPTAEVQTEVELKIVELLDRPGMCRGLDLMLLRGEAKGRCRFKELHNGNCDPNINSNRVTGQAPSPT